MTKRPVLIRKSDLRQAFAAAQEAGYEQVNVIVETPDGHKFRICAGSAPEKAQAEMSPYDEWKAGRAS